MKTYDISSDRLLGSDLAQMDGFVRGARGEHVLQSFKIILNSELILSLVSKCQWIFNILAAKLNLI